MSAELASSMARICLLAIPSDCRRASSASQRSRVRWMTWPAATAVPPKASTPSATSTMTRGRNASSIAFRS